MQIIHVRDLFRNYLVIRAGLCFKHFLSLSLSRLVSTLTLLSKKLNCYKITLECAPKNVAFYQKFSYTASDETYMQCRFFDWGQQLWPSVLGARTFIHPPTSKLAKCLKNWGSCPRMSLWLRNSWVVSWTLILISAHLSKHKHMLKPSAPLVTMATSPGWSPVIINIHPPPSEERNVAYCKCNVLLCYISTLLCADRENTNYICSYHATVSKYNCLGNQDGTKLYYYISEATK